MDKEAREKIAREIGQHAENCSWEVCSKTEQDAAYRSADFILSLLKELGYQRVPELKVLTGIDVVEETLKANPCKECQIVSPWTMGCGYTHRGMRECPASRVFAKGCQAQLDSIKRQIEEANK